MANSVGFQKRESQPRGKSPKLEPSWDVVYQVQQHARIKMMVMAYLWATQNEKP
jgi:hypothetical protein